MKKSFLVLITFVLVIFISCSKDDNGNQNDDIIIVPSKTINGQMKKMIHFNYPEDEVYHKFEDYDLGAGSIIIGEGFAKVFIVATGSVDQNGLVSLTFTTEVPNDKLTEIYKFSGDIQTSPSDLRTTWHLTNLELTLEDQQHASKNTIEFIEELPIFDDGEFDKVIYSFVCAEKDGTITGTHNSGHTVNMNLIKGWNIIKITTSENVKKIETVNNIPADAFFHYGWQTQF